MIAFVSRTGLWLAMTSAMMAPAAWPWITAFRRVLLADARGPAATRATSSFAAGYLVAWLPYSVGAAVIQTTVAIPRPWASAILVMAGLFQLAPAKRACLRHCRNPVSYFLSRWRTTPPSGFRIGFEHGLFCVGCCWALMATSLAVGVMNIWWMIALSAAVLAEQVAPRGEQVRLVIGVTLLVAGLS